MFLNAALILCLSSAIGALAFSPQIFAKRRNSVAIRAEKVDDFESLRSLDSRLEALEKNAPELLKNFYEPQLKSFSIQPGGLNVSTATSFRLIYDNHLAN